MKYWLDSSGPVCIREHDGEANDWSGALVAEIEETVDGRFMVLVNGFQWGVGEPDKSGAHSDVFDSPRAAFMAYVAANPST